MVPLHRDSLCLTPLIIRYKKEYLMFNDDIQGTAATVLAGLYGAMKAQGLGPEALKDQRILVCGAGSAGSGSSSLLEMLSCIGKDCMHNIH